MNVKEPHVVTGMSRDSAVSRQNPNLVYDAHNIRITTKDGKNSVLAVTNERGTKRLPITTGELIGTPIGSAVIDDYIILFTHSDTATYKDHIYRCEVSENSASLTEVFRGDAGFDIEHPIETLSAYENAGIQKVYWVDGKNQPRVINIKSESVITDVNVLNFSKEVNLGHTFSVEKCSTGGEFPVGTVQYAFSYYTKFGQESRLIDISPMYYLSPQENGLDATEIAHCSFKIVITYPDTTFDCARVYAIVRTSANSIPQCRIVGDYPIASNTSKVVVTDDGIKGRTFPAASMYFIGGEELVAGTLAEKDNTLFLGNIKLSRPNVGSIKLDSTHDIRYYVKGFASGSVSQGTFRQVIGIPTNSAGHYYDEHFNVPTTATKYYDYKIDNNRSSYYIRRFKYGETYRLGFIAQYKNGQWSEPVWVGDCENSSLPSVGAGSYHTGYFQLTLSSTVCSSLRAAGYKRVAPVVVYPQAHERKVVMQGLLCPTVYNKKDRADNSPYAQSSWFFRLYHPGTSHVYHDAPIPGSRYTYGEIQCYESGTPTVATYFLDGNIVTFHSPDIECVDPSQRIDLEGLSMQVVGFASAGTSSSTYYGQAKVTDHFLETEIVGIDSSLSKIVAVSRIAGSFDNYSYPLYLDRVVNNENQDVVEAAGAARKSDTLTTEYSNPVALWIVYPWHRQGSLNNQQSLTAKQRSNGFNARTAMLRRNITATAWFTNSSFFSPISANGIYTPKVFDFDQLASVKLAAGSDSIIYYGNIDKVVTSEYGKYSIYMADMNTKENVEGVNISDWAESALLNRQQNHNGAWLKCHYNDSADGYYTGNDPVSMKYKSSPHAVIRFEDSKHIPMYSGDASHSSELAFTLPSSVNSYGLFIAELIRNVDATTRFGGQSEEAFAGNDWIRCGDSVPITTGGTTYLTYMQGDCYIQRYDCLKTFPYTNEDQNSVIETLSATLETYVNLDFRYDHNRGSGKNIALSPINFNLYNHPAYEQVNNFFTYHGLDYERFSSQEFPNCITWSTEKHSGEDVDSWTSLDIGSSLWELDGAKGEVTALRRFRNDIYAFQKEGLAQLLFNSRVQIPTSDNDPIEITNGMKMQGVRYISEKIGCVNKWSIVETPVGLYFNDDLLKTTYIFTGQLQDLAVEKGMKSWMNERCNTSVWNPRDFTNCRAYYDKAGHDIYWVYKDTALVYSEVLGQYMSFMDYGNVPLLESLNNSTYALVSGFETNTTTSVEMLNLMGIRHTLTFTLSNAHTKVVHVTVEWEAGDSSRNPRPAARVFTNTSGLEDEVTITLYTCAYYSATLYSPNEILSALNSALPSFLSASLDGAYGPDRPLAYRDATRYTGVVAYLSNNNNTPFWELGKGEYNVFFDAYRPYWITLISNSYPSENKIFNNVFWRDIATEGTIPQPFYTFDNIQVWTEYQDTQPVQLLNPLHHESSRQPISYNAAISNLRKKFNVWHCQIPRDKLASNSGRARISNPWAYIKLSRLDVQQKRHEIENIEVSFFM